MSERLPIKIDATSNGEFRPVPLGPELRAALEGICPEGRVQVIDIPNAPFARPDLQGVLNGLKFVQEKKYPIRGTAT